MDKLSTFKMETVFRARQEVAVSVPVSDRSGGRMGGSLPAALSYQFGSGE